MELILLEKVRNLGDLGDRVSVTPGYGRNYLLPGKKAVRATAENLAKFQEKRAELERVAQTKLAEAQQRAGKLADTVITIVAKASDEGRLFGSVGTREIADAVDAAVGVAIEKSAVLLPEGVLRSIGQYQVQLQLHSDVLFSITVVIVAEG